MMSPTFSPAGVIPACILPFTEDYAIDEAGFRSHLRDVASVNGISGIVLNSHSTEVQTCTFDEQRTVLRIAVDEVGDRVPVISGVYTDSGLEAARLAGMARDNGAAGLLVFPPSTFSLGVTRREEVAIDFVRRVAEASDLPLILFQYPRHTGQQYTLQCLAELAERVPGFVAIKDWCGDPVLHEQHVRNLGAFHRPINVLTTHSAWLLGSLMSGCHGILSGSGSIVAHLQVQLYFAVRDNDLESARSIYERIQVSARVFYAEPWMDMHNRMKTALHLIGRIGCPAVRSPLLPLDENEIGKIKEMLRTMADTQDLSIGR